MAFFQSPPEIGNQLDEDRVLRSYLARTLPGDLRAKVEPALREMGELAGKKLFQMQLDDRLRVPELVQWDPWGNRVDRIEVTPLWKEAARIAAEKGIVATAYDRALGRFARVAQFALVYLFHPSSDVYTCPLAMTDGAARTLLTHGNGALIDRALPHLTSRDPATMWTSGQWMTERTGGSDVGISETVAKKDGDVWRLWGTKWFTSATTSQMALTLARPEGNPPGGRGLALFYVEPWKEGGGSNGILVNRLKDKLGTRKVPTAELTLEGAIATPVIGLEGGVRAITPMLNVTRTWNSICAIADMRRGISLARDFARRRVAFGAPLHDKPLHLETMAGLQAEFEAGFALTFFLVELMGRIEAGEASERDKVLVRVATPVVKAMTGKQTVPVVSEVLECFGGAGYIEDTGIPRLLRDTQVIPIWEGTTNVLSLDLLKAIGADGEGLRAWREEAARHAKAVKGDALVRCANASLETIDRVAAWIVEHREDRVTIEAGARGALLALGRSMALVLLAEQASWSAEHEGDRRSTAAAERFLVHGIQPALPQSAKEAAALANDEPLAR